ncbi:hypothetical protein RRF57_011047 [Xylaria bambusicola]|uniref:Hydrophobin n=1 Tax=Xylaria bambusicola TaxID=326684 RepID=A0AAN7UM49_9PEZI
MLSRKWLFGAALLAAPAVGQYPAQVVYPPNGLNMYASSSPFTCTSAADGAHCCSYLQNDSNSAMYYYAGDGPPKVIFTSQTVGYNCPDGNTVCNLVYQGDANLVLYICSTVVWASGIVSSIPYNLVFSSGARPLDIAGTVPPRRHFTPIIP